MSRGLRVAALSATLFTSTAALSSPILIAHERFVRASCATGADHQKPIQAEEIKDAPDDGAFEAAVSAQANASFASAFAWGFQTSAFSEDSLAARGRAGTSGIIDDDPTSSTTAGSISHCEFSFSLTAPAAFQLSGELTSVAGASAYVRLYREGELLIDASNAGGTRHLRRGGELEPGDYTLRLRASAYCWHAGVSGCGTSSSFESELKLGMAIPAERATFASIKSLFE
ncbi:MAG TPA: hypothetical protein VGB13_12315 [Candidatus Krumholzibacteria bacterium]